MVEPETFTFLADLALNNKKAWIDANRDAFDDVRRNFAGIAMTLHDYADRFDANVADAKSKPKQSYTKLYLEPRDRIGRALYRSGVDVFANSGLPAEDFGYYVHIEPGNCYAGAGLLQPSKPALARIRQRLVDDPNGLTALLADADFKAMFPDGLFSHKILGALPDGYASSKPIDAYLKMVGLGCRKPLPDDLLLDDDVMDTLVDVFRIARDLVHYFD